MRWCVKLIGMTGDVLAETLAAAGFALDGDMLSGEPFEALDEWGDVSDAAYDLAHRVREIARLNPEIEIGFCAGPVHEYDADGNQISENCKAYLQAATSLALAGQVPEIKNTSLTPEEQAEIARQARAEKAAQLMRAVMRSDLVLTIMRLLDGEPGSLELGHVHDLIQNDADGELSRYRSPRQFSRFNRSINHPDVLGLKARHALSPGDLPRDPMTLSQATAFMRDLADKWIKDKAAP